MTIGHLLSAGSFVVAAVVVVMVVVVVVLISVGDACAPVQVAEASIRVNIVCRSLDSNVLTSLVL